MIAILNPGPQATVQDLGRFGYLRYGIPPAGPMDRFAFVLANHLVGNQDSAAALECPLIGPQFEVDIRCAIAVTGADMLVTVNGAEAPGWTTLALKPGDVVKVGSARSGMRGYLAFSGGVDVPSVMGSRSTYLRGKLGGFQGRALQKGDRLHLLPGPVPSPRRLARRALPDYRSAPTVRVVLGPQDGRFTKAGIEALLHTPYEMLPQSDRMGARLRGERISHSRGHDIISDGIALGSIQVPGDGQPIILLVDRQSAGGYTKVATVCSFDIGRIAQTRPGQSLQFRAVTAAQAHRLLRDAGAATEAALLEKVV